MLSALRRSSCPRIGCIVEKARINMEKKVLFVLASRTQQILSAWGSLRLTHNCHLPHQQEELLRYGELELYAIPDALIVRTISIDYLGLDVQLPVRSWRDELFFRFAVMIKQKSVASRLLRALPLGVSSRQLAA